MLYHLFNYLNTQFHLPGAKLFNYLSFRAGLAVFVSVLIMIVFGEKLIQFLRKKQIGETIRDLGLEGQMEKTGTPTMGGLIIIAAIVIPTLLFANLTNVYIWMLIIVSIVLGGIGFLDDYIKVFRKNKEGLQGKFKIIGQVSVSIFVAIMMYFHPDIKVRDLNNTYVFTLEEGKIHDPYNPVNIFKTDTMIPGKGKEVDGLYYTHDTKNLITNVPFLKGNNLNYDDIFEKMGLHPNLYFIPFFILLIFIITAVSNGANITDGIDGLAAGSSALIGASLAVLTYVTGNSIFSEYLNVLYIPHVGELVIFVSAFVAACVGFLWWNSYPAQIFMGDTGSLALGGIIATIAIIIRKEMMIPVLCGIFLVENLSVMMQVGYFKYTKKKFGEGRRILLMSPLHHHYQKMGIPESKIVMRFWIVGILLAVITVVFLKLR
jgi:phospho-N-acetylmuramoyl-pentapeptide-transferase